jgi:hypothetical protein
MDERVKCPYQKCAHGMAVAHTEGEGCYAGDPTDEHCKGFVTDEEWEKRTEGEDHGRKRV